MNTTTEYKDADEAWEAGNEWIMQSDRWEKLDFLKETCSKEFMEETLLHEVVKFMSQHDFNEFFNHLRRNWAVMTPQELDYDMNS